jgi:hypothetical protein
MHIRPIGSAHRACGAISFVLGRDQPFNGVSKMTVQFQSKVRARAKFLRIGALRAVACAAAAWVAGPAARAAMNWTDWTAATTRGASAANTVSGTLNIDGSAVQASHRGATDRVVLSGADGWSVSGIFAPYATSGTPDKRDIIRIAGGDSSNHRPTFSAVVLTPILAFLRVGTVHQEVDYRFDQAPTSLDSGAGWRAGCSTCLFVNGNTVSGREGHGTVQFTSNFTELNWTAPNHEYWQGFTFGAVPVSMLPEPPSFVLMASGLAFAGLLARRRRR